jgi:UDP-N-acetylmuramoyl-tripeptide--D-alanyl-D-alanine ligase
VSTIKSYNTPYGITKTILSDLNVSTEVFVAEMGAKKLGEIDELCRLVDIDYGILTAIGRQHTSTFGSLSNIINSERIWSSFRS